MDFHQVFQTGGSHEISQLRFALFFAAVFAVAIVGCAATEKSKSTGEVIDDAAITAKVKSALIKDPELSAAEIKVDTYKGQVQLSGFVSDAEDVGNAGRVARDSGREIGKE